MKVCSVCEEEIFGGDGENICPACEKSRARRKRQREAAKAKRELMKSLGLTRVRGALGGIYYE